MYWGVGVEQKDTLRGNAGWGVERVGQGICEGAGNAKEVRPQDRQEVDGTDFVGPSHFP